MSETTTPPEGAVPVREILPWGEKPPTTLGGVIVKELRETDPLVGAMVRAALAVEVLTVAATVTDVAMLTGPAVTATLPVTLPGATVRVGGAGKAPTLLDDRLTTAPPLGAGPLSVTVNVMDVPLVAVDGSAARLARPDGTELKLDVADQSPNWSGFRACTCQ